MGRHNANYPVKLKGENKQQQKKRENFRLVKENTTNRTNFVANYR